MRAPHGGVRQHRERSDDVLMPGGSAASALALAAERLVAFRRARPRTCSSSATRRSLGRSASPPRRCAGTSRSLWTRWSALGSPHSEADEAPRHREPALLLLRRRRRERVRSPVRTPARIGGLRGRLRTFPLDGIPRARELRPDRLPDRLLADGLQLRGGLRPWRWSGRRGSEVDRGRLPRAIT